jgi:DNA-binding MarR family transcriptional regulator
MSEPRRLEHPNILLQSFINGHLVTQVMAEVTGRHGLTPDEFGVQSVIMFRAPITPTELAGLIGSPPTTLSAHIRRLAGRGQISRRRNPDDGRSYLLEITPEGRRTVEAIVPGFAELLVRIEAQLDSGDETRAAMQRFESVLRDIIAA